MTLSSASASVAVTVPAAVVFSATLNASGLLNVGASFGAAVVVAVAVADQLLRPSALLARTPTWYSVAAVRPVSARLVPTTPVCRCQVLLVASR